MPELHYIHKIVILPLSGSLYLPYKPTVARPPPVATQPNWVIVSGVFPSHHRREDQEHNDIVQFLLMPSLLLASLGEEALNTESSYYYNIGKVIKV